jgi:hypothetical protein
MGNHHLAGHSPIAGLGRRLQPLGNSCPRHLEVALRPHVFFLLPLNKLDEINDCKLSFSGLVPSNSESGSRWRVCSDGCIEAALNFIAEKNVLLESNIITFLVFSGSSNLEKCPGPDPRSRIVSNLRLISYITFSIEIYRCYMTPNH